MACLKLNYKNKKNRLTVFLLKDTLLSIAFLKTQSFKKAKKTTLKGEHKE